MQGGTCGNINPFLPQPSHMEDNNHSIENIDNEKKSRICIVLHIYRETIGQRIASDASIALPLLMSITNKFTFLMDP